MFRTPLLAVVLILTACGIDPAIPAIADAPQPLVAQNLLDRVSVHSLNVPDGTRVRFLLGMMVCGISVVGKGTATAQGGTFEIAYDPALSTFGELSLFFQIDDGTGVCDPEKSHVYEVNAAVPGPVDLSVLPEKSFIGCWLFELGN